MLISLQTIMDLILKTLGKLYQCEFNITSIDKNKKRTQIMLTGGDYTDRKYDVEIWYNYDDKNNEFIVRGVELGLLVASGDFPTYIGEYSCSNLVEFNKSLTLVFRDCRFKALELMEIA